MKTPLTLAALAGALAVALGAFGAHALKGHLTPEQAQTFETAVRYQMIHVLAVFAAASVGSRRAAWLFLAGIALFSGSLYGLVFTGWRVFGPMTPMGGAGFIAGWITLAAAARRAA